MRFAPLSLADIFSGFLRNCAECNVLTNANLDYIFGYARFDECFVSNAQNIRYLIVHIFFCTLMEIPNLRKASVHKKPQNSDDRIFDKTVSNKKFSEVFSLNFRPLFAKISDD